MKREQNSIPKRRINTDEGRGGAKGGGGETRREEEGVQGRKEKEAQHPKEVKGSHYYSENNFIRMSVNRSGR